MLTTIIPAQAWETAAHYQLVHSVAACAAALVPGGAPAGKWFLGGAAVFSGSIYALVLLDKPALGALAGLGTGAGLPSALTRPGRPGAVTPLGGLALIAGWLYLASAAAALPA